MTLSVEEKGLNSHRLISKKLQIQVPHISELPRPTMDEFASAMDELTTVMEGALQLEPERQNVPPYDTNAQLGHIAAVPAGRKLKTQEMTEGRPGMPSPPSSSYSSPITFFNTFSDEVPTRHPTRNPAETAVRPKAGIPPTPPEEPVQERGMQEAQNSEEKLQVTEEEHAEAINVLFGAPDPGYDDSEYDLFRISNWVC